MTNQQINNDPYSIRLGKLKALYEAKAHEKDMKLTDLIKAVLRSYIKKFPPQKKAA